MKLKYIVIVSLVVIFSFAYYIGSTISKESIKVSKVSSTENLKNTNTATQNKTVNYTKDQQQELLAAQKLVQTGKYPIQQDVSVVNTLKYDKGILIPKGTYIYKVNGAKIGLANKNFDMYGISNTANIKNGTSNPLQTKPSPYNVSTISTNAVNLNIIGEINGYYYVSYNEPQSSNISYAFIEPSNVELEGNTKPRQLQYVSANNLKLYKLTDISDYKVSGFNIYSTPYMFSNIETTLNYNELENFTPIVISTVGDATQIYYNGKIGWIHIDRLMSF